MENVVFYILGVFTPIVLLFLYACLCVGKKDGQVNDLIEENKELSEKLSDKNGER